MEKILRILKGFKKMQLTELEVYSNELLGLLVTNEVLRHELCPPTLRPRAPAPPLEREAIRWRKFYLNDNPSHGSSHQHAADPNR